MSDPDRAAAVIRLVERELNRALLEDIGAPLLPPGFVPEPGHDIIKTGIIRGTFRVRVPHYITVTIGFVDRDLLRWADDGGRV